MSVVREKKKKNEREKTNTFPRRCGENKYAERGVFVEHFKVLCGAWNLLRNLGIDYFAENMCAGMPTLSKKTPMIENKCWSHES